MNQRILKYLAAAAFALSVGDAPQLAEVPSAVLADVVGELERPEWDNEDRDRMLALLARDARPAVRAQVLGSMERRLDEASPLERVELIAEWSTSKSESQRTIIAYILGESDQPLAETAIDHLCHDPSPAVRALAEHARRRARLS